MDRKEHVHVDSYASIKGEKIYHVSTDNICDFFKRCEAGELPDDIIVLSYCCDYGIRLQADFHPNDDLHKHIHAVDWDEVSRTRDKYLQLSIGPTIESGKCNPSHKYAVRCDRYTFGTFDSIPENIKRWYCTNLDIFHERATLIPFGLNNDGNGSSLINNYLNTPKTQLLYVNFQNYTMDRVKLKKQFSQYDWVTFRGDANLPVEQYLQEIAEHQFVLSPPGNGLDCYRNYEAAYMGTTPILEDSVFATMVNSYLPCLRIGNLSWLDQAKMEEAVGLVRTKLANFDNRYLKLSTWKEIIQEGRSP